MNKSNLANGLLEGSLSADSTTLTLQAGYGNIMPALPFYITVTPFGQLSTVGNSEIIQVTARSGDTLTIIRGQRGTTAKSFIHGDVVSNGIYIEDIDEKANKHNIPSLTVPYRQGSGNGEADASIEVSASAKSKALARYGEGGTLNVGTPTDNGNAATKKYVDDNSRAKVGDIFMSMRSSPAAGRLFMAGGTYSKSQYPALWDLVSKNNGYGTTTSTRFTLKDMRGRMPIGKSYNGTFATLGKTGGEENVTLTTNQIPSHMHNFAKIVNTYASGGNDKAMFQAWGYEGWIGSDLVGNNTTYTGGGASHNNMPPYMVINFEVVAL